MAPQEGFDRPLGGLQQQERILFWFAERTFRCGFAERTFRCGLAERQPVPGDGAAERRGEG